jgi:hypothetical protein
MAKTKKTQKKKDDLGGYDFYVIVQTGSNPEQYLVDFNSETHEPTFGTDIDAAFWSTKANKVTAFISQNNLQNATAAGHNGIHPSQRPPF